MRIFNIVISVIFILSINAVKSMEKPNESWSNTLISSFRSILWANQDNRVNEVKEKDLTWKQWLFGKKISSSPSFLIVLPQELLQELLAFYIHSYPTDKIKEQDLQEMLKWDANPPKKNIVKNFLLTTNQIKLLNNIQTCLTLTPKDSDSIKHFIINQLTKPNLGKTYLRHGKLDLAFILNYSIIAKEIIKNEDNFPLLEKARMPLFEFLLKHGANPNAIETVTYSDDNRTYIVKWPILFELMDLQRYNANLPCTEEGYHPDLKRAVLLLKYGADVTIPLINSSKDTRNIPQWMKNDYTSNIYLIPALLGRSRIMEADEKFLSLVLGPLITMKELPPDKNSFLHLLPKELIEKLKKFQNNEEKETNKILAYTLELASTKKRNGQSYSQKTITELKRAGATT